MTKAPMNDLPTLLVMAAGLSRRFSAGPKLLADFGGRPLLAATMARLASVEADARLCVVPPDAAEILAVAEAYGYQPIVNPEPARGLGASLARGSTAVPDGRALLVCLGDMPFVSPEHIRRW
ncbi:MAG: NTP transferase domain-containing protein, partial [Pseudomonadota bacterium]